MKPTILAMLVGLSLAACFDNAETVLFECRSGADCIEGFVCAFDSDGRVGSTYDFIYDTHTYWAADPTGFCVKPCERGDFHFWRPSADLVVTYCAEAAPPTEVTFTSSSAATVCQYQNCILVGSGACPRQLASKIETSFYVDPALCSGN